jgi:hypothetical protein
LTPGQHFRQSSAPRSPTPASRRRLGRSRLRPFGLPFGAAMISPAVEPCFCGRLGNARGATDSCTKMLRAWGVSLPPFSRPGISCGGHCGQTGGSGSIPKMLRRPKPPSPRGPPKQQRGPAGHTQEAGTLPRPAPVPLLPQFLPVTTKKIPCGPSNTFSYCGVTGFSCRFGRKWGIFQF